MKTKYIKPSMEVVGVKTTSLLAVSFVRTVNDNEKVTSSGQVLSQSYTNDNVWGHDED